MKAFDKKPEKIHGKEQVKVDRIMQKLVELEDWEETFEVDDAS